MPRAQIQPLARPSNDKGKLDLDFGNQEGSTITVNSDDKTGSSGLPSPPSTPPTPLATIDRPFAVAPPSPTLQAAAAPHIPAMIPENSAATTKPRKSRPGRNRRSNSDIPPSVVGGGYAIPPYNPTSSSYSYSPNPPAPQLNYGGSPSGLGYGYPGQQASVPPYNLVPPYQPQQLQYQQRQKPAAGNIPPRPRGGSFGNMQEGYSEQQSLRDPQRMSSKSSSRRSSRNHRKSKSGSAAVPGAYGAFWDGPPPPPPPPPGGDLEAPPTPSGSGNKFSPRNELRKLTQGMSPKQSHHRRQQSWSSSAGGGEAAATPPPFLTRSQSSRGVYGGSEAAFYQQSHHSPSMNKITFSSPGRVPSRRSESSRKMHMRQQSAQLFMEETKGVKQELQCRNVLFLLLFVFHLVFVGYLGQLFGYEALQVHDKGEEVTIFYHNFIYIACLSGAFAIVTSALLLGAMMLFARHFVQIALIVVITISFIWGTVGIGVSPKTVVPVTGIIALGLAVAYTFIVWDRIPFAAANLVTALSSIRDYPGTILMAFGFQALTLAYAVTFSIVVVGVYDEIQEHRKMEIPPRMAYVIYVILAISFYWTFQVLQVSFLRQFCLRPVPVKHDESHFSNHSPSGSGPSNHCRCDWCVVARTTPGRTCRKDLFSNSILLNGLSLLWKFVCRPCPHPASVLFSIPSKFGREFFVGVPV